MSGDLGYEALPPIRRARGYRLYDEGGRRFLDMYLDGGSAILGHRPEHMLRSLKSSAAKGLWASFPGKDIPRLKKAIAGLCAPVSSMTGKRGYKISPAVQLFRNRERLLAFCASAKLVDPMTLPVDECSSAARDGALFLWRPFAFGFWERLLDDESLMLPELLRIVPVLPVPGDFAPWALLSLRRIEDAPSRDYGNEDPISASVAALTATAVNDLLRKVAEPGSPWPSFAEGAVSSLLWQRIGPYLVWKLDRDSYALFRASALKRRIVLPSSPDVPAIIPFSVTEGEVQSFLRIEEEFHGNL